MSVAAMYRNEPTTSPVAAPIMDPEAGRTAKPIHPPAGVANATAKASAIAVRSLMFWSNREKVVIPSGSSWLITASAVTMPTSWSVANPTAMIRPSNKE